MDARSIPEEPRSPAHVTTRREDYRPPDWLVPQVELDFTLDPGAARVRSTLTVTRNGAHDRHRHIGRGRAATYSRAARSAC